MRRATYIHTHIGEREKRGKEKTRKRPQKGIKNT
jgi:hypothetical protein